MSSHSLSFDGISSYLQVANDPRLNFGTGDFTIEWWHYTESNGPIITNFIFTIDNLTFAILNGGGYNYSYLLFFDENITITITKDGLSNLIGKWVHMAICRYNGQVSMYINGIKVDGNITFPDSLDFTNNLIIGYPSGLDSKYNIDYFTWVPGVARYTTSFAKPTQPPVIDENTVIQVTGDRLYAPGLTITNNGVTTSTNVPFTPSVYTYNKYALLTPQDPVQKKKQQALNNVKHNYKTNNIYNKGVYAGTNDPYNALHSLTRVRNAGAVVPAKARPFISMFR